MWSLASHASRILWTRQHFWNSWGQAAAVRSAGSTPRPPTPGAEWAQQAARGHVSPELPVGTPSIRAQPYGPHHSPRQVPSRAIHEGTRVPPRRLPLATPLLSLLGAEAAGPSKLPRLQRLCRSQPHLHPHAASPCGRAQAPPPCPAALSPRELPLLSPRSGLQAWPLRTLSQASGHRPRGPLPCHPLPRPRVTCRRAAWLTPGAQCAPLGSWLGDHVCHVLLFPPLLRERQGALRPTPCRPGTGHAGLAAPRRPALGVSGYQESGRAVQSCHSPQRLTAPGSPLMRIKARLLFPRHSCCGRHVIWGPLAPTAQMSQHRQHQGSSAPLLDPPPTSAGVSCLLVSNAEQPTHVM